MNTDYLTILAKNYLSRKGWFLSLSGEPQDANGAVPWITYPAATMLSRIIRPDFKVFEFGCGSSTVWWNKRVVTVVAVDHNQQWVEKIRAKASQATITHRTMNCPVVYPAIIEEFFQKKYSLPTSGNVAHDIEHGLLCRAFTEYASEILTYPDGYFDLVVVDGMARVLTAWLAARQLGPNGIVLFDNSERWQYNAAYQLLIDAGFIRLDFWGIGPVQCYEWCTSIFVRNPEILKQNPLIPFEQKADLGW
jgi:hypothetical protein